MEGDDVNRKEEDRPLGAHFVPACAVKMLFNMSQEPLYTFYTEIYRKKAAPQDGPRTSQNARTHFVRASAVEMHFNISQEPLYTEISRKNAAPQNRGADFVRACAVETHVKISQEPLYAEI